MIEGMINRAEFRFEDPINIDVPSQLSCTTIYLRMRGIHSEQTSFYPISGFPRSLITEDMITGTSLAMTINFHSLNKHQKHALTSGLGSSKSVVMAASPSPVIPKLLDQVTTTVRRKYRQRKLSITPVRMEKEVLWLEPTALKLQALLHPPEARLTVGPLPKP